MSYWTKAQLENMLEDVVNELDLSDQAISIHGQDGTAPSELVRLILINKDRRISLLESALHRQEANEIEQAMETLKRHMVDTEPGSYAHGWHCNIAMMCFDAIGKDLHDVDFGTAHKIGNDAASRFMKLCFGVETKA